MTPVLTEELIDELARKYAAAKGSGNVAVVSDAAMSFFHKGPSLLSSAREVVELRELCETAGKLGLQLAAENAELRKALEEIAEEHDAGRHDGLPEPCPAHDADTMFALARAALKRDTHK